MKTFSYLLLFVFVLALTVESCEKDKSILHILSSRAWIVSSWTTNGVEQVLDDCVKDNYYTFSATGTYILYVGVIKCDPSEPDYYTGTWSLSDDEKTIFFAQNQFSIEITENKLELTVVDGNDTIVMILLAMR